MKSMDFLDIPYIDHHGFTIPECWTFDPAPEMKLSNEFQKSLKDTFSGELENWYTISMKTHISGISDF